MGAGKMSRFEARQCPAFRSEVRASGLAEVWTHTHDNLKFNQFGWRCTTNENSYSDSTFVIGVRNGSIRLKWLNDNQFQVRRQRNDGTQPTESDTAKHPQRRKTNHEYSC